MALPVALRGSDGLWMVNGPPALKTEPPFSRDPSKTCKVMIYSKDGRFFAWCNGKKVVVIQTSDFKVVQEFDSIPKTSNLMFSPKGSVLATWEPYTVDKATNQGVPNLHLWDVTSGNCLKALIQKKVTYWAPQWTNDEQVCCRNVNNELHFFENNNFDEIKTKLHIQKVAGYSLSCAGPPYMVAAYVPGAKGQPSFVRVFKYPHFGGPNAAIANRTFFKADKVEMMWNKKGTAVLILTTTETSESSYYGDQGLYFIAMNGDSCLVHLGKNGPVYHVEWSPKSTEFCVVYGFMPAKATIYNLKADPVFDFGTGPRNFGFYNPQGTILCLCGFGNLRGNMEFWDVKQQKLINQAHSPDTTSFQWCADGEHVITATTSPRLRVGNGYRIWHYTGVILEQVTFEKNQELWEVFWQPAPDDVYKEKDLVYKPVQSDIQTPVPESKQAAYRPPGARDRPPPPKLHEYELPSNMKQQQQDPSQTTSKNKKKKKAKKAEKAEQEKTDQSSANKNESESGALPSADSQSAGSQSTASGPAPATGANKLRNLKKKLQQIQKLKEEKQAGKQLDVNQIEKIKSEEDVIKEIEALELNS